MGNSNPLADIALAVAALGAGAGAAAARAKAVGAADEKFLAQMHNRLVELGLPPEQRANLIAAAVRTMGPQGSAINDVTSGMPPPQAPGSIPVPEPSGFNKVFLSKREEAGMTPAQSALVGALPAGASMTMRSPGGTPFSFSGREPDLTPDQQAQASRDLVSAFERTPTPGFSIGSIGVGAGNKPALSLKATGGTSPEDIAAAIQTRIAKIGPSVGLALDSVNVTDDGYSIRFKDPSATGVGTAMTAEQQIALMSSALGLVRNEFGPDVGVSLGVDDKTGNPDIRLTTPALDPTERADLNYTQGLQKLLSTIPADTPASERSRFVGQYFSTAVGRGFSPSKNISDSYVLPHFETLVSQYREQLKQVNGNLPPGQRLPGEVMDRLAVLNASEVFGGGFVPQHYQGLVNAPTQEVSPAIATELMARGIQPSFATAGDIGAAQQGAISTEARTAGARTAATEREQFTTPADSSSTGLPAFTPRGAFATPAAVPGSPPPTVAPTAQSPSAPAAGAAPGTGAPAADPTPPEFSVPQQALMADPRMAKADTAIREGMRSIGDLKHPLMAAATEVLGAPKPGDPVFAITPEIRQKIAAHAIALASIDRLEDLSAPIWQDRDTAVGRAMSGVEDAAARGLGTTRGRSIRTYRAQAIQFTNIARAFGESGVLNEGDVERAYRVFPATGALPASKLQAAEQFSEIRRRITDNLAITLSALGQFDSARFDHIMREIEDLQLRDQEKVLKMQEAK